MTSRPLPDLVRTRCKYVCSIPFGARADVRPPGGSHVTGSKVQRPYSLYLSGTGASRPAKDILAETRYSYVKMHR